MATRAPKTTTTKAVRKPVVKKVAPTLDPRIFNYPVNEALLNQVIHVYRDNTHQNTSRVKNRGEINRTHHKVYKQKGTGNARHGARSAPIYVGGGVAHGPSGVKPALKKLNQKMKAAGLAIVLSLYNTDKKVSLITNPKVSKASTKDVKGLFVNPKTLLVYQGEDKLFLQSVKNLKNLSLEEANKLNPYTASMYQHIAITQGAQEALLKRLLPFLKNHKS